MLQLKVCGMKYLDNIRELTQIQPNFIGLIFHEKSPRNVNGIFSEKIAKDISLVGVFVNETESFIKDKVNVYNLSHIQLHGDESPKFCEQIKKLNQVIIKAFNIHEGFDFSLLNKYEEHCDFFVFDAFGKNPGGNGITFNWELINNYKGETPFLLSGGITENMTDQIKKIDHQKFVGIDINSGFEIEPGLKNIEKIKLFKHDLQH